MVGIGPLSFLIGLVLFCIFQLLCDYKCPTVDVGEYQPTPVALKDKQILFYCFYSLSGFLSLVWIANVIAPPPPPIWSTMTLDRRKLAPTSTSKSSHLQPLSHHQATVWFSFKFGLPCCWAWFPAQYGFEYPRSRCLHLLSSQVVLFPPLERAPEFTWTGGSPSMGAGCKIVSMIVLVWYLHIASPGMIQWLT